MASLSLYPQFETNLMSNRKVIEFLLQLKNAKDHGKNYIKVKPHLVSYLLHNRLLRLVFNSPSRVVLIEGFSSISKIDQNTKNHQAEKCLDIFNHCAFTQGKLKHWNSKDYPILNVTPKQVRHIRICQRVLFIAQQPHRTSMWSK